MTRDDYMPNVNSEDRDNGPRFRVYDEKTRAFLPGMYWRRVIGPGYVVAVLEFDHGR